MLRLIFTLVALLALLFTGAAWLVAQPSGREVREVVAPVLERGFEMVGEAGRRVALTPTASGVWEPDPAAPASAPAAPAAAPAPPEATPEAPHVPEADASRGPDAAPEPDEVEIVPWSERPFVESQPEPVAPPPAEPEVAALFRDQDAWAALIRRMLAVHARVSAAE